MTEEDKYILRVEGEENLRKLIAAQEKETQQLKQTLEAQKLAASAYGAASSQAQQYATQIQASASALVANEKAIRTQQTALSALGGNLSALNGAIRNVGFGISDVFSNNGPLGSKIGGFANNVGNITTSVLGMFGKTGPAALAAAAGLEIAFTGLGAALNAFGIKSVGDLVKVFTGGVKEIENGLKGLEGHIKELESKPVKLAVDVLELDSAKAKVESIKAALAAFDAVGKLRGPEAKATSGTVTEAIAEAPGGGEAVRMRVKARIAAELEATDGPLAEARQEQEQLAAALKEMRDSPHQTADGVAYLTKMLEAAKEAARSAEIAITGVGGAAEQITGNLFNTAIHGQGLAQKAAQDRIAGFVGGTAGDVIAGRLPTMAEAKNQTDELDKYNASENAKAEKHQKKVDKQKADELHGLQMGEDFDMAEGQAEGKRREALIKEKRQKAVQTARDVAPDLSDMVDANNLAVRTFGGKFDREGMAKALAAGSGGKLTEDAAGMAIDDALKGSNGRIDKKVRDKMGQDDRGNAAGPVRQSQVLGLSEVSRALQSSVSSDPGREDTRKQTSLQEQMVKHLADLASRQGGGWEVTN